MGHSDEGATWLILVVEDEFLLAMEMESCLRDLGYAVLGPAPSIQVAAGLLDRHNPHAALLDVNLRGTVAPIARRLQQRNIPYALVTGYARLTLTDPVLAAVPRLGKPVSQAEVALMLSRLLRPS